MRIFSKYFVFSLLLFGEIFGASKDPVRGRNGMVVSASDLASDVGIEILKKGGNAVDAAVAVGFALAVTYPQAGNIGGGGFMVIHLKDGTNTTIDYREKAPAKAHRDMFLDAEGNFDISLSTRGWTASGVPGSVAGLIYALEKYGLLSLEEVISPAIRIAQEGFKLNYRMAGSFSAYVKRFNECPASREIFTKNGAPFSEDDLFVQKDLAETLKRIRKAGRDGFYKGKTARLIADDSRKNGGLITLKDLADYRPVERKPVFTTYRGYQLYSMGPPSSGGIALSEILNSFENFNFDKSEWGSGKYIHTLSEILKQVYADRSKHLGDSDYYPVPADWLVSKEYAEIIASRVKEKAVPSSEIFPGEPFGEESEETTHYSVVDKFGNAVSTTTTINSTFGNKIVVEGAGFLLNNEMDDFSAKPGTYNQFGLLGGEANAIEPGKRMLSAMTPTILLKDGKPFIVIGSPGGSTIITVVMHVIINCVDFGMDIQQAIDQPRFHHQWKPERIDYERFGMTTDVIADLERRRQIIGKLRTLGRAEGIMIDKNGVFWGASDPRGFGKAAGY